MFASLQSELVNRLFNVNQFFNEACNSTNNPHTHVHSKGWVFVQLYAVYEYAVTESVFAGLQELQSHGFAIRDVRLELLSIFLEPELLSVATVGSKLKWSRRSELFRRIECSDAVAVPSNCFPGDGSHFRRKQLDTIWSLFGLTSPIVTHPSHMDIIDELVEHRNAIAHGRERAEMIGGRFSSADIQKRLTAVESICLHIVSELQSHCSIADNLRREPLLQSPPPKS